MTLRRRTPLAPSRGTLIPVAVRAAVTQRDPICVGRIVGLPGDCIGGLELDHVRASGAVGMKSASIPTNLVRLCGFHHWYKGQHGRSIRPLLIAYIDEAMARSGTIG
jgi:hypothetical protein